MDDTSGNQSLAHHQLRDGELPNGERREQRDDDQPAAFVEALGARLRSVRKGKRLSLHGVQAGTGEEFKASALGAYERGERIISVPRLQRLAKFYGVPVDELLPPDPDAETTPDDEPIDLVAAERTNRTRIDLAQLELLPEGQRELVTRYIGMIVAQREAVEGPWLTLRADDVRTIALMLDIGEHELPSFLERLRVRI